MHLRAIGLPSLFYILHLRFLKAQPKLNTAHILCDTNDRRLEESASEPYAEAAPAHLSVFPTPTRFSYKSLRFLFYCFITVEIGSIFCCFLTLNDASYIKWAHFGLD